MKIVYSKPRLGRFFLIFCIFLNYESLTVAPLPRTKHLKSTKHSETIKKISKNLSSRHLRVKRANRNLEGRGFFNGSTLGAAGMGAGAYLAFKNRSVQQEELKNMTNKIKTQMNQFFVLNQKNQEFYHEMDEHLTELEEKVEDFADTSVQKLSEFDLRIRSKLNGKPFMPLISYR